MQKKFKGMNQTMAFKKTMTTKRDERKGSLKRQGAPQSRTHVTKQRRGTQRNETHTTQSM